MCDHLISIFSIGVRIGLLKEKINGLEKPYQESSKSFINRLYFALRTNVANNTKNSIQRVVEQNRSSLDNNDFELRTPISTKQFDNLINEIRQSCKELYLILIQLTNFHRLNSMGFRKILRKYDHLFETKIGAEWR